MTIKQKTATLYIVIGLMVVAGYLRWINRSAYLFYPDSYVSLIIARNIQNFGGVVGRLGENGMIYPDFFAWTRPLYPLLINLFGVWLPESAAARAVPLAAGVLAIPAAYWLGRWALGSAAAGWASAVLLAVGFNHAVWGGYVLGDTVGVLMLMGFLAVWWQGARRNAELASPLDLLAGGLLGLAVLARYEYVLVLVPVVWMCLRQGKAVRCANLAAGAAPVLALALRLFSLGDLLPALGAELSGRLSLVWAGLAVALAGWLAKKLPPDKLDRLGEAGSRAVVVAAWAVMGYMVLQNLWPAGLPWLSRQLGAWRDFVVTDWLISTFALIGLTVLLWRRPGRGVGWFAVIGMASLAPAYYGTNPEMQRYITHLLPFWLLLAASGLVVLTARLSRQPNWRLATYFLLGLVGGLQALATSWGLGHLHQGIWRQPGYEQVVASRVAERPEPVMVLAAFPEPFYVVTGRPVHSLAGQYPYIYIPDSLNGQAILVVNDVGMRDQFPQFAELLDKGLLGQPAAEFWTGAPYRYGARIEPEYAPVRLYHASVGDLKTRVEVARQPELRY
jgi:hypothetical protein